MTGKITQTEDGEDETNKTVDIDTQSTFIWLKWNGRLEHTSL